MALDILFSEMWDNVVDSLAHREASFNTDEEKYISPNLRYQASLGGLKPQLCCDLPTAVPLKCTWAEQCMSVNISWWSYWQHLASSLPACLALWVLLNYSSHCPWQLAMLAWVAVRCSPVIPREHHVDYPVMAAVVVVGSILLAWCWSQCELECYWGEMKGNQSLNRQMNGDSRDFA